jgi:hypothetical protein
MFQYHPTITVFTRTSVINLIGSFLEFELVKRMVTLYVDMECVVQLRHRYGDRGLDAFNALLMCAVPNRGMPGDTGLSE